MSIYPLITVAVQSGPLYQKLLIDQEHIIY